jgi:hypothetical protein
MADYGKLDPLALANALKGIAPHGFRHVESLQNVSLPKGSGWMGYLPNKEGSVSTEISADNNGMQYPLLVPTLTKQEIEHLLANKQPTEDIYKKAEAFAKYRQEQGQSPFISSVGELKWPTPQE